MTSLLEIKEKLKQFYGRFDIYLNPLFKFILALCVFSVINGNIGYMKRIGTFSVTLVLALICSLLPVNIMILSAAAVVLAHLYALSLEVAAVAFVFSDCSFIFSVCAQRRNFCIADTDLPAF